MAFDSETLIDSTNRRILAELQKDARISMARLAQAVGLSAPAVAHRVQRLEDSGVITGYRAVVSPRALGRTVLAFVRISAAGNIKEEVRAAAEQTPEVLECYRGTGGECFILKVAVRDIEHLEAVTDRFSQFGVLNTTIIMSTLLENRMIRELP